MTRLLALLALLAATPALSAPLYGVNIAGGEFGSGSRYGYDYLYPQPDDAALVKAMGSETVRVPIHPDRVAGSLPQIKAAVSDIRATGQSVLIDLHDFGYWLATDRATRFALVSRLILTVSTKANSATIAVGLGQEPAGDPQGLEHALDTRDDLRAAGFKTRFIVPSQGWSGIAGIVDNGSVALFNSRPDPQRNTWLDGHLYGDAANSGADQVECVSDAANRLDAAIASGVPIVIGEAGFYDTPVCRTVIAKVRAKLARSSNVMAVYFWGYGRWWPNDYPMLLRKQDATATRLFHCLMWVKGVCP